MYFRSCDLETNPFSHHDSKTSLELSLYEAICIIIFFRLPNSGLYLFIGQELYLHGGKFIRTCGSFRQLIKLYFFNKLKTISYIKFVFTIYD